MFSLIAFCMQALITTLELTREVMAPFTSIQPSVVALSCLRGLYIHDTDVTAIPDFVGRLPLNDIQIRKSPVESISDDCFAGLAGTLMSLTLSDCAKFASLPETIGRCERLESVSVNHCRLAALPESLMDLPHLRFLRVFRNSLAWLPSYWSLIQLQELDVSHNSIAELPEAMTGCLQLTVLRASHNRLKRLPPSLGRLVHLLELDVSTNALEVLPDSLGHMTSLHSLNVAHNRLKAFPASLGALAFLHELDASANLLEAVPAAAHKLFELTVLKLDGNPLFDHRSDTFGRDMLDVQLKRILAARAATASDAAASK